MKVITELKAAGDDGTVFIDRCGFAQCVGELRPKHQIRMSGSASNVSCEVVSADTGACVRHHRQVENSSTRINSRVAAEEASPRKNDDSNERLLSVNWTARPGVKLIRYE
jgi:hypothetical protein